MEFSVRNRLMHVFLGLLCTLATQAQHRVEPLILDDPGFTGINIHAKIRAYTGPLKDVHEADFSDVSDLHAWGDGAFEDLPDTVWMLGTLVRQDPSIRTVLISACEQVSYVECYLVKEGKLELLATSTADQPYQERTYPTRSSYFNLDFDTDTIHFLFRSHMKVDALKDHYYHVNVYNQKGFVLRTISRMGLQSFYAGLLSIVILIALFMSVQFREKLMLSYAAFIFCLGMYFVLQQGLSEVIVPSLKLGSTIINQNLFVALIFVSGWGFVSRQLVLKRRSRSLYWTYFVYSLLAALYSVLYRHIPVLAEGYNFFNISSLVYVGLTLYVVVQAFIKKVENSRSTLISMALLLFGSVVYLLSVMGVISQSKFAQHSFQLGVVGFALSLLYGLFLRIRQIEMSKAIAITAKEKSDELLFNVLPEEVANELKTSGRSKARSISDVSILFTDFKDFTEVAELMSPEDLVDELHQCFVAFDEIIQKYDLEKIKTIGDSYMAAGGLDSGDQSVRRTVLAALEMAAFISDRFRSRKESGSDQFRMRIGIHTGQVVAGIVGIKKFQYDIWGDTVNTASRMESHGEVGKVNISQTTYERIKDDPQFAFEHRGKVEAKGKGEMDMYFVSLA